MPLGQFKQLIDDLKSFDFGQELREIVSDNTLVVTEMQQKQMMEGRGVDGEYIRPFYSENPYFKSPESAERYAAWKQKITPNDKRPKDVPNLFINGAFHDSLFTEVNGDEVTVETSATFGKDVFNVHKNAQGLNEDSRKEFGSNRNASSDSNQTERENRLNNNE